MYGLETSLGPKLCDFLPTELKNAVSPTRLKRKIREWIPKNFPCRLCKTLDFSKLSTQTYVLEHLIRYTYAINMLQQHCHSLFVTISIDIDSDLTQIIPLLKNYLVFISCHGEWKYIKYR